MDPTGTLNALDGTRLSYYDRPLAAPRAVLCVVHGLGEHAGRHAALALRLNEAGIAVRTYDQRGHGRSAGPRGGLALSNDLLDDLRVVFDDFAHRQGMMPFLLGHSLGGLVAAHFVVRRMSPVRGLVLSSPALALRMSAAQRLLLSAMLRLAPDVALPNGLELDAISHDAAVIAAYRSDPLVHRKVSARLVGYMREAIDETQQRAAEVTAATLLCVAGADRLVDPAGSRRFADHLASSPHELRWYDDSYHEIFNESADRRARALDDLVAWLDSRINR